MIAGQRILRPGRARVVRRSLQLVPLALALALAAPSVSRAALNWWAPIFLDPLSAQPDTTIDFEQPAPGTTLTNHP